PLRCKGPSMPRGYGPRADIRPVARRSKWIVTSQQLFWKMLDVFVLRRRHLQVIALPFEIRQDRRDVLPGQLALGGQDEIEGMLRRAERRQQRFRHTRQRFAALDVEVHLVSTWAFVD